MSTPKHTPGPWQADYPDGWGGVFIESACAGHPLIASLYDRESAFPPDDDERKANARLISAAPELLAELEAAHWIIRYALAVMTSEQKVEWGRLNASAGVDGEGITRANERDAAIAKATGEQA
jgi:hypothetical protein